MSSLTAFPGLWVPRIPRFAGSIGFTATTIDATGEKLAWCGPVDYPGDDATKAITKVQFLPGTIVSAGGSVLTLSLQDLSTSTGAPTQPDGTQDQTVSINASALTSDTWFTTGALSASRTVAKGALLAVVLEFNGGGRLGSDSIAVNNLAMNAFLDMPHGASIAFNDGSWGLELGHPNVILEFTDGTFGTISMDAFPCSAVTQVDFNSGSGADELAMEFTVPVECKCDAFWVGPLQMGGSANLDVVLYNGTSAIATTTLDGNQQSGAFSNRILMGAFPTLTLSTSNTYRLAIKPTTANDVTVFHFDVSNANHLTLHGGGTAFKYTTRVDAGSWAAATSTRRLFGGIRLTAVHDGAGGGGSTARVIGG